jgi:hypothetical protein
MVKGDEPDQQCCSSAVPTEGVDHQRGGVAVDARLAQLAIPPISTEEILKQREKRETPEWNLDENGNVLKFSRDLDSDWTVKNNIPPFGLKEHASMDTRITGLLSPRI